MIFSTVNIPVALVYLLVVAGEPVGEKREGLSEAIAHRRTRF